MSVGVIGEEKAAALAKLTARSDPTASADCAARVMARDLRPQMHSIRVPVIELSPCRAGDYAPTSIVGPAKSGHYRSLPEDVEENEVVSFPQARHFAMIDKPKSFMQALARFLLTVATTP